MGSVPVGRGGVLAQVVQDAGLPQLRLENLLHPAAKRGPARIGLQGRFIHAQLDAQRTNGFLHALNQSLVHMEARQMHIGGGGSSGRNVLPPGAHQACSGA